MKGNFRLFMVLGAWSVSFLASAIDPGGETSEALEARFTYEFVGAQPCVGVEVTFTDETEALAGGIVYRTWDFSDGEALWLGGLNTLLQAAVISR